MKAVKAHSRAELEQAAREQYAERFARVAPPKVRNARALVALGERRALRWRGHGYTIGPLPFHAGVRLLVCGQVMRDDDAPPAARERAMAEAMRVARSLARTPRGRRPLRNPFRHPGAAETVALIDYLLAVPDESPPAPPGTGTVDLLDGLMEYLRGGYPVTPAGLPASWAHYQYGLRHAARHAARETLRLAQASRVAWTDKETWKDYTGELQAAGGW